MFTPLSGEKVLETLKPERLAFIWLFLLGGIFTIVGIGVFAVMPAAWPALIFAFIGILIIIATFFYSKAFTYYITDKRVVMHRKFITISTRQVQYDDISDVAVDQGIIGRIFGFGNVIPVSKSGLGLGYRGGHMGYGFGRGRGPIVIGGPMSGQTVPIASPSTCIYGVKDPSRIQQLIFKHQEEYAEVPYLKRIAEAVEKKKAKK